MALVADSGALYALYDKRDRNHRAVREALQAEDGPILIPAALLAEIDYLLRVRTGIAAEQRFLEGIEKGAFTVEALTIEDAAFCRKLLTQYEDLDLGLADASVIATAERLDPENLDVDRRDSGPFELRRASPLFCYRRTRMSKALPLVRLPPGGLLETAVGKGEICEQIVWCRQLSVEFDMHP